MTEWLPLKRLARLTYGDALAASDRTEGKYPVVGSGGVSGSHNSRNFGAPGIVVGRKGSCGSVHWIPQGGFAIDTAYFIDQSCSSADLRWLYYALQAVDLRGRSQDVGVPGLSREAAHEVQVPIASFEEQRRIADFLDTETSRIDRLVDTLRRTLILLAERRAAGVLAEVSGSAHYQRRSSGLAWVETLPSTWLTVRLGLIARMGSGHTPSRSRPEWWTNCTIPWVTTGEVRQIRDDRQEVIYETRERISEIGLANSAAELHPAGTVVLSRTASAGYSAIMGSDMATSQDFATWTCGPRLEPFYLLWCLRAMRQDLLGRLATGSTHKTIYFPDLQMLRIPLPRIDEQKRIVENIRVRNSQIDLLSDKVLRQIELLTERRAALITAAVNGEFDVTTASGRGVAD